VDIPTARPGRDLDDIVGFVHAKDLLSVPDGGAQPATAARPHPAGG